MSEYAPAILGSAAVLVAYLTWLVTQIASKRRMQAERKARLRAQLEEWRARHGNDAA